MFCVIYSFKVKPNQSEQFLNAWHELTELIYKYEGSLGSRLHQLETEGDYVAYAQWPSKAQWENAGGNLPEKSKEYRAAMLEACDDIQTVYEMDMVDDLLSTPTMKQT